MLLVQLVLLSLLSAAVDCIATSRVLRVVILPIITVSTVCSFL
jgi:hypothetical protein